ncbi:MAG: hypothetical protein ABFD60_13745 [Bryobacteraceae bacterium]
MASIRQINANRDNARRSTGPVTEEGKARSARNSLRHGLQSRDAVMPGEDAAEFAELVDGYIDGMAPEGPLEEFCVRQMAVADWKLRRTLRLETGFLANAIEVTREDEDRWSGKLGYDETTVMLGDMMSYKTPPARLAVLSRYEASVHRAWYRALAQFQRLRSMRPPQSDPPEAPGTGNSPDTELASFGKNAVVRPLPVCPPELA